MRKPAWVAVMTNALLAYVGAYLLLFLVPLLTFWLMSAGPPQAMVFLAAQKAALACVPIGIFLFVLLDKRTRRLSNMADKALKEALGTRSVWLTRMTHASLAFGGAYLIVFLGPLAMLWMWTAIGLTQELVFMVAKKSFLFAVAIGLTLFVSLEISTRRRSIECAGTSKQKA
jgi:hypothetical protein